MTQREPDARPTAGEVAEELARIAAGGTATTVLASPPPVADRTQVLQQTRVAPVPPRPAVEHPATRTVAPAPAAVRNDSAKWVAALVAVVALLIGGAALAGAFQSDDARTPAPVSEDLPPELRQNLERLQREVRS